MSKTKELKERNGVCAKRESFSSVLEAVSRARGSPFKLEQRGGAWGLGFS